MANMTDILEEALFRPDDRLIRALDKKLNTVETLLLKTWLDEERRAAAEQEWNKQKHRIPDLKENSNG